MGEQIRLNINFQGLNLPLNAILTLVCTIENKRGREMGEQITACVLFNQT